MGVKSQNMGVIRAIFHEYPYIRFDPNPQSLLKGTDLENAPARVYNTNFVRLEYRGLGWYYEHDHRVCWYFELIIWSVGILIGLLVF